MAGLFLLLLQLSCPRRQAQLCDPFLSFPFLSWHSCVTLSYPFLSSHGTAVLPFLSFVSFPLMAGMEWALRRREAKKGDPGAVPEPSPPPLPPAATGGRVEGAETSAAAAAAVAAEEQQLSVEGVGAGA
eukprot:1154758-Pelagomonas_calceolata.AAC.3